jgi:6-phosphogluconate dehydrogenase
MKVGLIGLGRMGEGMSRRMMKTGIEVWGYRRNYEKTARGLMKRDLLMELQLILKILLK